MVFPISRLLFLLIYDYSGFKIQIQTYSKNNLLKQNNNNNIKNKIFKLHIKKTKNNLIYIKENSSFLAHGLASPLKINSLKELLAQLLKKSHGRCRATLKSAIKDKEPKQSCPIIYNLITFQAYQS